MSNQLPMAINPSKTSKEHVLDNFLNCFTFIDTEKQLVIAYPVFLHLGYTKETAQAKLSKPMILQYTNCKGFVPREDFFISIPQIGELIVNAPKDKYIPHILKFIKNTLTPLFKTQPQKHDDFKKEIDMNIITTNQPLTMSSQEMADLTETRHDSVKRTMETLQNKGIISFTQTVENPDNKGGRPKTVYHVNKRDSYVVVAQLSPEFTAKLVDRWQELENKSTSALPNFADPAEAAIAWANQYKEKEKLHLEIKQIETQIAEDKPYTKLGKIMTMVDATIKIGEYAIMLQNEHKIKIGQNRLFEWLRERGYLCKEEHQKNRPTQKSMELGLFAWTERVITTNHGEEVISFTPRITGKGQAYFIDKLIKDFSPKAA